MATKIHYLSIIVLLALFGCGAVIYFCLHPLFTMTTVEKSFLGILTALTFCAVTFAALSVVAYMHFVFSPMAIEQHRDFLEKMDDPIVKMCGPIGMICDAIVNMHIVHVDNHNKHKLAIQGLEAKIADLEAKLESKLESLATKPNETANAEAGESE